MTIRHHALAFVAACLILPPAASAQTSAESAVRAWLYGIDAAPGWDAGFRGVSFDASTDTTTISGLSIQTESASLIVTAETVTVTGFAERAGGGFGARAITADSGVVKVGFASLGISDLEVTGLVAPAMAPVASEPDKPFTTMMRSYAQFLGGSIESARIGSIEVIEQFEGVTSRVSYGHLRMDGFANGKVTSVRAGPMTMESPSPQGLVKMTIGAVESRDIDLKAFVDVYNPDAYAGGVGDMIWRPVMGIASYSGIEMEVPGAKLAFGEVAIENFRMRQPPKSFAPLIDAMMSSPKISEEQGTALAKAHALDIFSAFGVGHVGIDRFEIAAQGLDHFRLDSITLDDFSSDGIGAFALNGLDLAVPEQGAFKLGSFGFGGIVFPSMSAVQAAIEAADTGAPFDPKTIAAKLGYVELTGVDLRAVGKDPVVLGRFRMDLGDYIGYLPTRVAAEIAGVIVPTSVIDNRDSRRLLERLGYETLDMSYGLDMHWDAASETVAIDDLSVGVKGVGSFVAKLALVGLPRWAIENPERLGDAFPSLQLKSGSFTFRDESIVGKSIDMLAETMKAPPDRFRQQFADAMPFLLSISALNDPKFLAIVQKSGLMKQLQPAVKEFVGTPGSSITVTVAPPTPVPLTEVTRITDQAPDTLVSVLGLTVSGKAGTGIPDAPAPSPAPAPEVAPAPAPTAPGGDDAGSMRKTLDPQ